MEKINLQILSCIYLKISYFRFNLKSEFLFHFLHPLQTEPLIFTQMTEEELLQLIEKYKNLSVKFDSKDEEKSMACERFAGFLEDYPLHSGLSDSDTEENL